ncbi:sigma 54-interacting transcriptional regulator [Robertmurraya sp. FSL R5-0851]|uniref:sigma 54-interacting transcriptional regulator n=1 Tax=Robertmurraya sp. FSL R5-0851 TaxID=2921584 RepID=UPI0030F5274C
MSSIVIIVPFKDLADISKEACLKIGAQIPVINIPMNQVVDAAKQAENSGAEVIISRGIAAWNISQSDVRIPVVSIPISGYDMLRAFTKASEIGERIGIVDSRETLTNVESLELILKTKIEKIAVHSLNEAELAINELIEKGIDVLIGRYSYVQLTKKRGIKSIIIRSGVESIIQAISEAESVLKVRQKEINRTKQLQAILDFITDGVISVDHNGVINVCNPAFEKMLNTPYKNIIGKKMDDLLSNSIISRILESGKEEINRIQEINGMKVIANHIPIHQGEKVLGIVSTFQEINKLQQKEHEIRKKLSYNGHITKYSIEQMVGESEKYKGAVEKAIKYAKADSTILLSGETGVGKEVFAHIIHSQSTRSDGPFVAVNCAAIPLTLLESELFGYVEGAFSGAKKGGKSGLFEMAHNGTIFLDEIGEMEEQLQARLLRVLQEGEVRRLGDDRVIRINVRVITATNRNLEELVKSGNFRTDLYYRINILNISIPPLRERKKDIPLLCESFIKELNITIQKNTIGFDEKAIQLLQSYPWPGNIRELRNIVERSMILSSEDIISSATVLEAGGASFEYSLQENMPCPEKTIKDQEGLIENEKAYILGVLKQVNGNKTEAAKILGIGRSTLWRKLSNTNEGGTK